MKIAISIIAATLLATVSGPGFAATEPALEDAIITSYTYGSGATFMDWQSCKAKSNDSCFSYGRLTPLTDACAMLEGKPTTVGDSVSRNLYVVTENRAEFPTALMNVYLKTDTHVAARYKTTIVFKKTVKLGLAIRNNAHCYIASTSKYVFVGTSASNNPAIVNIATMAVQANSFGGSAPPTQIAATDSDYVIINYPSSFLLIYPTLGQSEDGPYQMIVSGAVSGTSLR